MGYYLDGVHYFQPGGGYGDTDHGLGYFSIKNNALHAIGKPARVNQIEIVWMVNGKKHREDGPAIEQKDGHLEYWLNDKRHRIGGPAIIFANGDVQYYQYGKCSRKDGPAVEYTNGHKEYWVEGKQLTPEEFYAAYPQASKDSVQKKTM